MNYLYIACDQLRSDAFSVSGNTVCTTPNIDRLAREGVNFVNAYTTAPLCTPARGSIFTGNYAFKHGMGTNCDMYHALAKELPDPSKLLHHAMLTAGYRCGYIGKWHVGTMIGPCDYGYEGMNVPGYGNLQVEPEFKEYLKANGYSYEITEPIYLNPGEKTMCAGIWDGPVESHMDWYLTNRTIDQMRGYHEKNQKFFLTCQFWSPHGPHLPPKEWYGRADRNKIEQWKSFREDLNNKPEFVRRNLMMYRAAPQSWKECREIIGRYYDMMMFVDNQIGRMLDYLEQSGELENTVIFFSSDHGDMQFVHNGVYGKGYLYQEAVRVPLMMRHPAYRNIGSCDALVSNMDILPTIRDDMGIPAECDGQSMLPLLRHEIKGRDCFLMEFHGINYLFTQRAVVDRENYKYIWTPGSMDELYDLNTDPDEMVNLIDYPAMARKREQLQEQLKHEAVQYRDPVMDHIYKILGQWENPSGQVDCTNDEYNQQRSQ